LGGFINDIESGKKWLSSESLEKCIVVLKVKKPHHFFISDIGDDPVIKSDPYT
jgi:hypothetical protein